MMGVSQITASEVRVLAEDEQLLTDTVAEGLRRKSIAVDVCYDSATVTPEEVAAADASRDALLKDQARELLRMQWRRARR